MTLPRLQPCALTVLAGAGISLPSGIASGQTFNERMLMELLPSDGGAELDPIRRWLRDRPRRPLVRFEQLVGILRDVVDPELSILGYLEESWEPTTAHFWMAEAMRAGARLVTTNLDSLIEVAYRRSAGAFARQIADVDDYIEALLGVPPTALLKLHGTLRRQAHLERLAAEELSASSRAIETVAVTLDAIGRLEPSPSTFRGGFLLPEYVARVLEEVLRDRDLLVIGYSGSDDFDIMPTLRALRRRYRRVIWVQHGARPRAQRVGELTRICGDTVAVLRELVPEIHVPPVTTEIRSRFDDFLEDWRAQVGLDDAKRRVICGEILRQSGFVHQAVALLQSVPLDAMLPTEAPKVALRLGETMLPAMMSYRAIAPLEEAASRFHAANDAIGFMRAQVDLAAAIYETSLACGEPPVAALSQLARWMPHVRDARQQVEVEKTGFRITAELRRRLVDNERWLQVLGMRATLLLSRIARRERQLGSVELAHEVSGQPLLVEELLDEHGRFPAVHEDKLLYVDYLAEVSLVNVIRVRGEDPWERRREFEALCRLLGLHHRQAVYLLELGDVFFMMRAEAAAVEAFEQARKIFERIGDEVGHHVALVARAALTGEGGIHAR